MTSKYTYKFSIPESGSQASFSRAYKIALAEEDVTEESQSQATNSLSPAVDEATGLPRLKLAPPTDDTSTEGQLTEDETYKDELDNAFEDHVDQIDSALVTEEYHSGISRDDISSAVERRISLGIPKEDITAALKRKASATHGGEEPPFIEDLSPENIHVIQGGSFQLCSEFIGSPQPTVQWHRGKTEIVSDERITIETSRSHSTLTVIQADMSDTGCYVLTLNSELGSDKVGSSVTVEGRHCFARRIFRIICNLIGFIIIEC